MTLSRIPVSLNTTLNTTLNTPEAPDRKFAQGTAVILMSLEKHADAFASPVRPTVHHAPVFSQMVVIVDCGVREPKHILLLVVDPLEIADKTLSVRLAI
jgi:hypothetical protein